MTAERDRDPNLRVRSPVVIWEHVFWSACLALIVAAGGGALLPMPAAIGAAIVVGIAWLMLAWRAFTMSLTVAEQGLLVRNLLSRTHVPWDAVRSIRAFMPRAWEPTLVFRVQPVTAILIERHDGSSIPCWATTMMSTRSRDALVEILTTMCRSRGITCALDDLASGPQVRRNRTRLLGRYDELRR